MSTRKQRTKQVENRDVYPATSRYRNSTYYQRHIRGIGVRVEPSLWEPPEIPLADDDLYTQIQPGEEGRLDLVAVRVYRNQDLWWVLGYYNSIVDPFTQTPVGTSLRYPRFERIASLALS